MGRTTFASRTPSGTERDWYTVCCIYFVHPGIQDSGAKEGCIMAAIRFGGWANDNKIEIYMNKLKEALMKAGLKHKDNFSYFGYNPPYELINRRNEVVVELTDF